MNKFYVLLTIFLISPAYGDSLREKELPGIWQPSTDVVRKDGVQNYKLVVKENMNASYIALEEGEDALSLRCDYKPSTSQSSVFVYYCYLSDKHLITLSLAGWNSESNEKFLFGYEYWLGYPEPGEIHGGLPVSLTKVKTK